MPTRAFLAAALLVLSAMPSGAGVLYEETPAEFAFRFYHTYGALRVRGIPNEKQRRTLAPFLSSELLGLFAQAERLPVAAPQTGRSGPKQSPVGFPESKSDFFTSNSDGCADTFAIGFPRSAIGRLILPMHLADPATDAAWVDELVLHQHGGRWLIADIVFTHDPHNRLCGKGTLRHVLNDWIHRMKGKNRGLFHAVLSTGG